MLLAHTLGAWRYQDDKFSKELAEAIGGHHSHAYTGPMAFIPEQVTAAVDHDEAVDVALCNAHAG